MDRPFHPVEETFWSYIRGTLDEEAFESWVYANPDLEAALGPDDFFAIVSADYRDKSSRDHSARVDLARDIVTRRFPRQCVCLSIPDIDRQDLAANGIPLEAHLDVIAERTPWIRFGCCRECGTHWLLGIDTVDDNVFVYRLSADSVDDIFTHDRWPKVFDDNPSLWSKTWLQQLGEYEEAIRRNPNDAETFFSRGVGYVTRGDNDAAFLDFDQAIRLRQDIAWPFVRRGDCHRLKGDHGAAMRDYDRALALDNNEYASWWARFGRAGVHHATGDFGAAIKEYDRLLERTPQATNVLCNRGTAYAALGKLDLAIVDLDRAVARARQVRGDSLVAEALADRARVRFKAGDEAGGNADLAEARMIEAARAEAARCGWREL